MFNFGNNTINWIKSLQLGSTSKILQNGHFSQKIVLGRGCRQGDPVSPYLFVLTAEIMAEAIISDKEIEGITLFTQKHLTSLFADDTTLFLSAKEQNIRKCMLILKDFELVSGLKVNKEKTKVVKLGGWRDNGVILCPDLNLDWTQEFTSLGIKYNINNFNKIADIDIEIKIEEIKKLIGLWNARNLTPYGKIIIIKSLLISKITHILLSLPSPTNELLNKLEKIFKNFLRGQKPPKFRKEIMETLPAQGGLKLTNLGMFDIALKVSWMKRLINQDLGWAEFPIKYGILNVLKYGDNFPKEISRNLKNKFWFDMLRGIIKLDENIQFNKIIHIQNMPLWYSSTFDLGYRKNWETKGFQVVNDVLDENGELLNKMK